jgi:PhzF family phenazine biosynthesis protein
MHYWHLDVFAERPLTGNSLTVFPDARGLSTEAMQGLTRELRQFETIFLEPAPAAAEYSARIFTLEEELPFAGHPILGAAALLHHLHGGADTTEWRLRLAAKSVQVQTRRQATGYHAEMDQGQAEFGVELSASQAQAFAEAFSLGAMELDERYPARVVSTGLPYLLLPVTAEGLVRAKQKLELDAELERIGAAFVFLLDVDAREGRTWDPLGVVEDIATGSAAGPVAAFLVEHGLHRRGERFVLNQGRFLGRPSRLEVCVSEEGRVSVGGAVQVLAKAELVVGMAELTRR